MLRTIAILSIAALAARADFSYTTTTKSSMGSGSPMTAKHWMKGQKMKVDRGDSTTIMDFDAQTITSVHHKTKTYTVTKFSDVGQALGKADVEFKIDFKETGQRKNINGYNASEVVMTMEMDSPQGRQAGMKMQMESDMWVSGDMPGAQEVRTFYQKNAGRFPWMALSGGAANPSMQKAMADLQRRIATMDKLPVLQVTRMKMLGNEAQMAQVQQASAQARARMEEMKKKGGPEAAAAERALAMMGGQGGGSPMFETTVESSNFSTGAIAEAEFAIPAGYQKTEKPDQK